MPVVVAGAGGGGHLFGTIQSLGRVKRSPSLPRDLLGALQVAEHELGPELKRLIALELFREERISSGKAAELLGLSKAEFVDLLDQHGLAYFTETPEELEAQVKAVREKLKVEFSW